MSIHPSIGPLVQGQFVTTFGGYKDSKGLMPYLRPCFYFSVDGEKWSMIFLISPICLCMTCATKCQNIPYMNYL